ncbi:uncharacterized protein LOC129582256 [Paramacrobiotus metropolitanus]|uniref:uncharacterized protein LOC129582256 n=1 Tax=Paramacrobiotus metropolitanus TaxID=2943436 RepID=UPI002445B110|nr:uncharacterized protein LOC129582256 [Paramacrobiotus metropolitanus]
MKTWIPFDTPFEICHWRDSRECFPNRGGHITDPDRAFLVDVFLRLNSDEPWKWHHGKTVMTNFEEFAGACRFVMVAVDGSGATALFIVPNERVCVRDRISRCVASRDEKIDLQLDLRKLDILNRMKSLRQRTLPKNSQLPQPLCNPIALARKLWGCHSKQEESNFFPGIPANVEVGIQWLPAEIMSEVFGCIETKIQQSVLRSVCSCWNAILTTYPIKRFLIFAGSLIKPNQRYYNAACLHACWRPAIVFSCCKASCDLSDKTILYGPFLRQIMMKGGHPCADTLILGKVVWDFSNNGSPWVTDYPEGLIRPFCRSFSAMAVVCQTLILKDILATNLHQIISVSEPQQDTDKPWFSQYLVRLKIRNGRIQGRHLSTGDWWDLIESSCPTLDAWEIQSLSDWIDDWLQPDQTSMDMPDPDPRNQYYDPTRNGAIPIILREFQAMDPRPKNRYQPVGLDDWKTVNLQVNKLNKLTLYALRTLQLQPPCPPSWLPVYPVDVYIHSIFN